MGRKKSAPRQRVENGDSEYHTGLFFEAQETLQQVDSYVQAPQRAPDPSFIGRLEEANRRATLEREQDREERRKKETVSVADQETEEETQQQEPKHPGEKVVTFAANLVTEINPRPTPEIEVFRYEPPKYMFSVDEEDEEDVIEESLPYKDRGKYRIDEMFYLDTKNPADEIPVEGATTLIYHVDPERARRKQDAISGQIETFQLLKFKLGSSSTSIIDLKLSVPTNFDLDPKHPFAKAPFPIYTAEGALTLLELCLKEDPDSGIEEVKNIALAVEEGFLCLLLDEVLSEEDNCKQDETASDKSYHLKSNFLVTISLTKQAFDFCSPSYLSVGARKSSKAYQKAMCLQSAIAELFPKGAALLKGPISSTVSSKDSQPIIAKQVYAHVDNVQFKTYLSKKKAPNEAPLEIPGLLPKLRPYQEAAVRWMIQREQLVSHTNVSGSDEWELAWVVICIGDKTSCDRSQVDIVFLPDFKKRNHKVGEYEKPGTHFFYCPFSGWLASTYDDAKFATIGRNLYGQSIPTGGMLCESMGLGKTVEVLACILANPDAKHRPFQPMEQEVNEVSGSSSSSSLETLNIRSVANGGSRKRTQSDFVQKRDLTGAFDDAEDKLTEDIDSVKPVVNKRTKGTNGVAVPRLCNNNAANVSEDETSTGGLQPTQAKINAAEERWIDPEDCELGSCICGKSISLFQCFAKKSVVICKNCEEPMHLDCAAFGGEQFRLKSHSKAVLYRKKFSEEKHPCLLCPEEFCPCCVAESAAKCADRKIRSGATVIVTPPAILNQWEREIKRHTRNISDDDGQHPLKVTVYTGIKDICNQTRRKKNSKFRLLHPRWLADADIVLMTFDALLHDLGHSDKNPFVAGGAARSSLRKRKRYRVVPSPLSSVSFWRVALDEAQRVETPTAGSAQMALKLKAKHRWAVSGTPIGRGKLDDLYGLLLFLRLTPPFSDKAWFRQCFASVSDNANIGRRIHHLLGNVFWRSTASFDVVRTQMGVPAQIEKKNYLKFSSVEKHFYERQLEETLGLAGDVADQEKARKRKATNNSLDMLVQSLHKLRAACCHPQVGSSGIVGTTRKNNHTGASAGSVSTRVLTMEQVLDRLIDDARNKCEEALRVVIFHTNPMASISRLKVEAKNNHGVSTIKESDEFLLAQSSKLYLEALKFADENAIPCLATGAVVLNGSPGFRLSHKELHYSKTKLDWQIQHQGDNVDVLWASFEFTGQSKKMKQVRIRSLACVPESLQNEGSEDFIWNLKSPKDCVLQISNAALGGEFQDILSLSLPKPTSGNEQNDWVVNDVSTIYKSKSWRLVIKSFHPEAEAGDDTDGATQQQQLNYKGFYAGMEVELLEPTIATDSLQRLHALHNAAISLRELSQVMVEGKCGNSRASKSSQPPRLPLSMSRDEMEKKAQSMDEECDRIERYHLEYARGLHSESRRRLEQAMNVRKDLEHQLLGLSKKKDKRLTFWDCTWWNDLVAHVEISGSLHEKASLCEKAQEILDNFTQERGEWHKTKKTKPFPAFYDINGLQVALTLRFDEEQSKLSEHDKYMKSVLNLSTYPSDSDVYENRNCQVCKLEWHMTGPKCRHCIMGDKLREIVPDGLTKAILDGIWKWSRVNRSGVRSSNSMKEIVTRANKFFETLEAAEKESNMASKMWRFHLDLLNVVDELHSCKTPMRLLQEGENISSLTEEQRNSIVVPVDVVARYYEHDAKQATALANLRHSKHTLQYLKNLSTEQADNNSLGASPDKSSQDSSTETCQICLSEFDAGDKAVLKCGHCYHLSPCLEKLKKRSGSVNTITCPLRCRATTKYEEVLIASNKRKDDGTQSRRKVEGSWGTKVTAIVGDLLGVSDLGEKSIVFSMWEEMLDIMEEALTANGIKHARATSLQNIGEATKEFRAPNCFVLLLNVKNSAEGLTLIEANHVFMIEPLLNYGLDSQARARCHRIGQVRQTYLHRYLITDTIEEKIDGLRIQHQEDQLEDAITEGRKCSINAGGVDGGFSSPEELMDILKLK